MRYSHYAVRRGYTPGIYTTWNDCKREVSGFKGQEYKGFTSLLDAQLYMSESQIPDVVCDEDAMVAYTDGSYSESLHRYGCGGIITTDNHTFSFLGNDPDIVEMRNVAGEIEAAKYAMQYALDKGAKQLHLYYDYEGVEKLCTGSWSADLIGTRRYRDYYRSICSRIVIKFMYVKAHSHNEYNDIADSLAKSSLRMSPMYDVQSSSHMTTHARECFNSAVKSTEDMNG